MINKFRFEENFFKLIKNKKNKFHPLTWINGKPKIGAGTYIGGFSIINAKDSFVSIGKNCDIASFVSINVADTHLRCIGKKSSKVTNIIIIENNVFIGTHSAVLGGSVIGHNSVIGAGTVIRGLKIPPYSLIVGNPPKIKKGYYKNLKY
jgi:acetyltransferase-like isoleucine patch superfamily enzyme